MINVVAVQFSRLLVNLANLSELLAHVLLNVLRRICLHQ